MFTRRKFLGTAWAGFVVGPSAWHAAGVSSQTRIPSGSTAQIPLAVRQVKGCRDAAIAILRRFARQPYGERDEPCLKSLAGLGVAIVPELADALGDRDEEVRLLAAQMLRELGDKAEPALPHMIHSLHDPNRMVRTGLAQHVGTFREKAKSAVPILQTWISTDDEFSRLVAAASILKIDPSQVDGLLPVLVDALDSDHLMIPDFAAWLLRDLGELAQGALPRLRQMLHDDDSSRKCAASEAIWAITGDPRSAVQVGLNLLDGADWLERVVGAEHLGMLGPQALYAVPRLRQALGDGDETVRETVRTALAEIQAAPSVSTITG